MDVSPFLGNSRLRLEIVVCPGVVVEGMAVGKCATVPLSDQLSKDRGLPASLPPNDEKAAVLPCVLVRGMVLKRLTQKVICIGVDPSKVGDLG